MTPIAKAKDLVRLAAHPDTPNKEALAAAFAACKLIDEHKLLDQANPFDGIVKDVPEEVQEIVRTGTSIFRHLARPEFIEDVKGLAKSFLRDVPRRRRRYE